LNALRHSAPPPSAAGEIDLLRPTTTGSHPALSWFGVLIRFGEAELQVSDCAGPEWPYINRK
jgi:hypothetical protein